MTLEDRMNAIYRDLGLEEIPWNMGEPPDVVVDLIEAGQLRPCDAVDLGCGLGTHAVWLASLGFRVTGIDLSSEAVEHARRLAGEKRISCQFIAADLSREATDLVESFDFAYDWKVLHHVFPEHRAVWAANVHRMLRPGGTYASVCFSEAEPTGFPGEGKYRDTPLGTTLYLSSEEEVRAVFEPHFEIESIRTVVVAGRSAPHTAVRAVMRRSGREQATARSS